MTDPCDPIQCNSRGLDCFAAGDPDAADLLLRKAYRNLAEESGILVNLGLALMQKGLVDQAERAYRLALRSNQRLVRRSAAKNLGFLLLWRGDHQQGWHWHGQRFQEKASKPTSGVAIPSMVTLTVWNDVGWGMPSVRALHIALVAAGRKSALCSCSISNFIVSRTSSLATKRSYRSEEMLLRRRASHSSDEPDQPFDANTLSRRFGNPHGKQPAGVTNRENMWGSVEQAIPKTAPCMPIKAAHQSSYLNCSECCCQHAQRSACKPMRPKPISA